MFHYKLNVGTFKTYPLPSTRSLYFRREVFFPFSYYTQPLTLSFLLFFLEGNEILESRQVSWSSGTVEIFEFSRSVF